MKPENNGFDLFDIDENRLDEEWVSQPRHYYEQAVKLADARKKYEQMKAEKDVVEAELDFDVRSKPGDFDLEKITEPVVKNTILLQPRHKEATKALIESKHSMDIVQAIIDALDHRKKALENLVSLRLANYFSEPKAPKGYEDKSNKLKRDSAFKTKKR